MNISEIFIRRPIATTLLMTAILLFGPVGYELMPVAALPNVSYHRRIREVAGRQPHHYGKHSGNAPGRRVHAESRSDADDLDQRAWDPRRSPCSST
jgi:hypothetical protein